MPAVSEQTKQNVARLLVERGLVRFAEEGEPGFKLKSGVMSPFYIDLRLAQSYPDLFHAVTEAYVECIGDVEENVKISGIPEAGTPLATAVGYHARLPLIQPRKVIKDHGTGRSIEGVFEEGDKVVVVDDLVTKGDSKIEALRQFTDNGLVVEKFAVLIDREQGGAKTLEAAGYHLESVMTIHELISYAHKAELISDQQAKTILEFIENN